MISSSPALFFQASTESDQRLLELLVVGIYLGIDVAAVRFLGGAKHSQGSKDPMP